MIFNSKCEMLVIAYSQFTKSSTKHSTTTWRKSMHHLEINKPTLHSVKGHIKVQEINKDNIEKENYSNLYLAPIFYRLSQ